MQTQTIRSKIDTITVFADRAQVCRVGRIDLTAGETAILFDALPEAIDPDSLQARGQGAALLRDVKLVHVQHRDTPDSRVAALLAERERLSETRDVLNDQTKRIGKEREFIDRIVATLTNSGEEPNSYRLEPERWIKMVEFYRSRLDALATEQRDCAKHHAKLQQEIDRIKREVADIGESNQRSSYQAQVILEANAATQVDLTLSYMVYGPSWYPVYDLRVDGQRKQMTIGYHAMVSQASQEDWEDAEISLSTAQPHIGGKQPELTPWRIEEYVPPPPSPSPAAAKLKRDRSLDEEGDLRSMSQMFDTASYSAAAAEAPELAQPTATVTAHATSAVFTVAGRKTIRSDNQPHRVTVMMESFPAQFRYSTVPKLAPYAYLKAKVKNTTPYPFLPGESQIFLDNQFVAKAYLSLVAPSEEFWTSLGVDAAMKVEYQLLRRVNKQSGLMNKTRSIVYEYRITLTNNKAGSEEIVVWDQLPVSAHEKLVVKLITPEYRGDSAELKKNDLDYLEWFFQLKPGEKRDVLFSFSVEHPLGMQVVGV